VTRSLSLFVLLSLALCGPARALERRVAEWDLRQGPYAADAGQAAVQCLTDVGVAVGLADSGSTLEAVKLEDRDGVTTVRLQQHHAGLPVLGSHAVVRFDPDGHATSVNARLHEQLWLETRPAVTTDLNLAIFYWLYTFAWINECRALQDTDTRFGAYFQLSFTTPSADAGELLGLTIDLVAQADDGGPLPDANLDYTVYLRRDEMVTFEMVETPIAALFPYSGSGRMPLALDFDLEVSGNPGQIELTPDSALTLTPDTTYYLAVSHMNCENVHLGVTPQLSIAAAGDDDDSSAEDDDPEVEDGAGGCQCRHDDRTAAPAAIGFGLLALAATLRRARGR